MQRTGRSGHAMFRVVVQDSRRTPTSGKIVAQLGSYDPHAKTVILNKERALFYLEHGAQPSDRVVHILKAEGVKLPSWVREATKQERSTRNPDKRRSTAPPKPVEEVEVPAEVEPAVDEAPAETEEDVAEEVVTEETPAEAEEVVEKPEVVSEASDEVPAESEPVAEEPEEPAETAK